MLSNVLTSLGINVQFLFAGLAGGVVIAGPTFRKSGPLQSAFSVVAAGLTAAYLTEPAGHVIGLTTLLPAAFIVGICASPICQAIVVAAQRWTPQLPQGDKQP